MQEEILKLKQMMKDLTDIKDKVKSEGTKGAINNVIMEIKDIIEFLNF